MKRRKPLKRGRPLRADPELVREFMQRGRGQLTRSGLQRRRKPRPQEGPLTPWEWRERVFELSGGVCIITGSRAKRAEDRGFHAHHVVPKRELRARRLYCCVWDPRNGAWLRADVHAAHENAVERVPWPALPRSVWEFAAELDVLDGSQWATLLVKRLHPVR